MRRKIAPNTITTKTICSFGEMILRLSPSDNNRLELATTLDMDWGGSELNTSVLLSRLGYRTFFVTILSNEPLGQNAKRYLLANNINIKHIHYSDSRMPLYYYEKGSGLLGGNVIYDRKNSCFANVRGAEFNWCKLLRGVDHFHFSGITPALSKNCEKQLLKALKICKNKGIKVSCDVNYRKSLWSIDECKKSMTKLLSLTDICIINEEHASSLFGITSNERDENGELTEKGYIEIASQLQSKFGFDYVAMTIRRTISSKVNLIRGMIYKPNESFFSKEYLLEDIVDRIGGGDAFSAGLIFCLTNGDDLNKTINFAVAANAIKHYIKGDSAVTTMEEIEKVMKNEGIRLNR